MKKTNIVMLLVSLILIFSVVFVACGKTYTVSFDLNGGVGEIADQSLRSGEKATRPTEVPTHENQGLVFDDWYDSLDQDAKKFDFDTPITSDTTIYAKYKQATTQPTKYPINFILGEGGTGVENIEVEAGGYATMPTQTPTREGYEFTGWFIDEDFKTSFDFEGTAINSATDIYAGWRKIDEEDPETEGYKINYILGEGGSGVENTTVSSGGFATKPETDPVRSGYRFTGWYMDEAFENEFNFEETAIDKDTNIYAGWISEGKILLDSLNKLAQGNFTALADLTYTVDGQTESYNNVVIKFNNDNEDLEISLANDSGDQIYLRDGYMLSNRSSDSSFGNSLSRGFGGRDMGQAGFDIADNQRTGYLGKNNRSGNMDNNPEPKGMPSGQSDKTYSTIIEAMFRNSDRNLLPMGRNSFSRNNFSAQRNATSRGITNSDRRIDSSIGGMGGDTGIGTGTRGPIDLNLPSPNGQNSRQNKDTLKNKSNMGLDTATQDDSSSQIGAQEPALNMGVGTNGDRMRSATRLFPYGGTGFGTKNIINMFSSVQNLGIDENFITKLFSVTADENGLTYTMNINLAPALSSLTDSTNSQKTGTEVIAEFLNQINDSHNKIFGDCQFDKDKINSMLTDAQNLTVGEFYSQLNLDSSIDKILAFLICPEDLESGSSAVQELKNKSVMDLYTEIAGSEGKSYQEFISQIHTTPFSELLDEDTASWVKELNINEFGCRLVIRLDENDDIIDIDFNLDISIAGFYDNQETQQNIQSDLRKNNLGGTASPMPRNNQNNFVITEDSDAGVGTRDRSDRGANQTDELTAPKDIGGMGVPSGTADGMGAPPTGIGRTNITEPTVLADGSLNKDQELQESEAKNTEQETAKRKENELRKGKIKRIENEDSSQTEQMPTTLEKEPPVKDSIIENSPHKKQPQIKNEIMGNKGNKGKRRMPNEVTASLEIEEQSTETLLTQPINRTDSRRLDTKDSRRQGINARDNDRMGGGQNGLSTNRLARPATMGQTQNPSNLEYRIDLTLKISEIGSTTIDYDTKAQHNLDSGFNFDVNSADADYNMPFETFGNKFNFSSDNIRDFNIVGGQNNEEVRQYLMNNIRFENNNVKVPKDALGRIRDYGVTGANFMVGGEDNPTPVNFRFNLNNNSDTAEVAPFRGAMAS